MQSLKLSIMGPGLVPALTFRMPFCNNYRHRHSLALTAISRAARAVKVSPHDTERQRRVKRKNYSSFHCLRVRGNKTVLSPKDSERALPMLLGIYLTNIYMLPFKSHDPFRAINISEAKWFAEPHPIFCQAQQAGKNRFSQTKHI